MTLTADVLPEDLAPELAAPASQDKPEKSAWRYLYDVLTTALTVVIVMIAAVAVVISVATRFDSKGQYTFFSHPAMVVLSGSMSPVIRTGDLIIDDQVNATRAEHLHVGQIASFRESAGSDTIITHRIVGVTTLPNGAVAYVTKGDANNAADSPARPATDVVGVYSSKISRGGYILNDLHQPFTLGLLLASPILWFIAGSLFQWARKMDDEASRGTPASAGEAEGREP